MFLEEMTETGHYNVSEKPAYSSGLPEHAWEEKVQEATSLVDVQGQEVTSSSSSDSCDDDSGSDAILGRATNTGMNWSSGLAAVIITVVRVAADYGLRHGPKEFYSIAVGGIPSSQLERDRQSLPRDHKMGRQHVLQVALDSNSEGASCFIQDQICYIQNLSVDSRYTVKEKYDTSV
ncbi:hypothetical protein AAES_18852 [Amazona aestiva]|uniref:Uncharacterized protein n=1 Tax=Amazona aestiva TaxID=12930 RepID=A0A0Q3U185_AMAAE|nr:hypothetical protein AAES_18852 [Amazona aestiva]